MRRLMFGLGALLLAGIACAQSQCDQNELMTCFTPFSNLHFDVVHGFTIENMQTICKDWSFARPCVHNFIGGQCQNALPEVPKRSLAALEKVAEYVCNDALAEIIKEHDCFFSSHAAAEGCQKHLGLDITRATSPYQLLMFLKNAEGCVRVIIYEECVIRTMKTTCSAKASDVVRHIYDIINNELQELIRCKTPMLPPLEPAQLPPVPRLPEVALHAEEKNCPLMETCRSRFAGLSGRSSERCRKVMETKDCLQRVVSECKISPRSIDWLLKEVHRDERHYNCNDADHVGAPQLHNARHHMDHGMKIAISVGVAAIALVLVTLLVVVWHVRRRRAQQLDRAQLIDKETYNSNLAVAVEEANKEEKKVVPC